MVNYLCIEMTTDQLKDLRGRVEALGRYL